MQPKLVRSENDKFFGGVCGGIAAYLNVDTIIVRIAFIFLIFASGIGLPLYFILMLLMPSQEAIQDHPDWQVAEEIKITEEDIDSFKSEARRSGAGAHPQGPIIFAVILILIGAYLLAGNMGLLGWLDIGWFGPLLIIGIGLFVIYRRRVDNGRDG
jgi:phage shock protein C